ncbi:MAG: hypothetical protein Q7I99_05360 [Acholeplasmataceae bacterium]|nr:hypothetical protein [Acholeplasmataceae bacterium]
MKNIGTFAIIGIIALYLLGSPIFDNILGMTVRIVHFLLIFYVVWIMLFDFFRSLRKKLGEKFGLQIKRMKRKIFKLKRL